MMNNVLSTYQIPNRSLLNELSTHCHCVFCEIVIWYLLNERKNLGGSDGMRGEQRIMIYNGMYFYKMCHCLCSSTTILTPKLNSDIQSLTVP